MSVRFQRGIRQGVKLWLMLIGESGSGKTFSGMLLAKGLAGGKTFAVGDTENGRALHYADQFKFDHTSIEPPFRPESFTEVVKAAEGYPVLLLDTPSHEHYGEGGLLDWHEEEVDRMAKGGDWSKRDRVSQAAWIKPKLAHKKMVQAMLRFPGHLIICLRAEEKTKPIKDPKTGKMVPTNIGFKPICEKNLPYEATVSLMLSSENPGVPIPLKLQEQHRNLFPVNRPITAGVGEAIAQWAEGGKVKELKLTTTLKTIQKHIAKAETLEDLHKVGLEIAEQKLTEEEKAAARGMYTARKSEIG